MSSCRHRSSASSAPRSAAAARTARSASSSCAAGTPKTPSSSSPATRLDRAAVAARSRTRALGERPHRRPAQRFGVEPGPTGETSQNRTVTVLRRSSTGGMTAGTIERRILAQDRLLELAQRGARLEAELVHERPARVLVGGERVGLAARAVEREHELTAQSLAERMLADERLELADERRRAGRARARRRSDPPAPHGAAPRGEVSASRTRLVVGEVGERRAAPERECLAAAWPRASPPIPVSRASSTSRSKRAGRARRGRRAGRSRARAFRSTSSPSSLRSCAT